MKKKTVETVLSCFFGYNFHHFLGLAKGLMVKNGWLVYLHYPKKTHMKFGILQVNQPSIFNQQTLTNQPTNQPTLKFTFSTYGFA